MPPAEAPDIRNPVKTRMGAGDVALGLVVRLARSGDITRIAKTTGHDFIFIDRQHSLFSLETVGHIAQAALGCGVAPLVRVRSCGDPDVSLLLDGGATGIVFPDVSSAADAGALSMHANFHRSASARSAAAIRSSTCGQSRSLTACACSTKARWWSA